MIEPREFGVSEEGPTGNLQLASKIIPSVQCKQLAGAFCLLGALR